MAQNKFLEAAIDYANQGFAVFPLYPKDKFPIYSGGFKIATTNPKQIGAWWRKTPNANIGIATGQASGGLIIIDLDVDDEKGINGFETMRDWERTHGELPDTSNTITGRGGYHLLFKANAPIKNRVGVLPGVDVRGDGGYIVAPPSIHPNGRSYEWEQSIDEFGIAPVNDVVMAFISSGDAGTDGEFIVPDTIPAGERNNTLFKMACSLQSKRYSDNSIRILIESENQNRCVPPLPDDEIEKILESALSFQKGIAPTAEIDIIKPHGSNTVSDLLIKQKTNKKDESGNPIYMNRKCIDNIVTVLRNDPIIAGKLRFDEIAHAPKYLGQLKWRKQGDTIGEWNDYDDANLRAYLDTMYGLKGADIYDDAVQIVMMENSFNPIVSYLEAMPEWDGVERIKNLLPDYLGADHSRYTFEVMKLFMMGALSRVYYPGCKFDYMLVLVGDQGSGKSTFLRYLALNDTWYDDNLNTVEGKEAIEKLRGKWILELAELMAVKKQRDVETIKAFITTQSDSYREPYARRTTDRKRHCVFAATTNDFNFLTDRTGNRRFLPIEINPRRIKKDLFGIDTDAPEEFKKAWAEALYYFKQANKHPELILPKDIQAEAIQRQLMFLEEDSRVGIIQKYLDTTPKSRVCILDIWHDALEEESKPKKFDSNQIHAIMRNEIEGWKHIGKQRTVKWGVQFCYERIADGVHFVPVDDENDDFDG